MKYKTQIWLLNNIIKGGYLLGNNNLNRAKFKFEELAVEKGFINTQFSELNKKLIKNLPFERIEGYMYSKKK